jgi:hypothetical protein
MKLYDWKRMAVALMVGAATLVSVGGAQAALGVGDKAPAFTLPSTIGKQASSKDFAGKTLVLFFYTGAFTGA